MQGKTHAAVGMAAAFAVMPPKTSTELLIGMSAATIGALFADSDSPHSLIQKNIRIAIGGGAGLFLIASILSESFGLKIELTTSIARTLLGCICLVGFGVLGSTQPHRGIMHSVFALIVSSFFCLLVTPQAVPYFVTGYASHLVLDILNYQGISLLWPLPAKISIGLCKSDGTVNDIMLVAGILALAVELNASPFRVSLITF